MIKSFLCAAILSFGLSTPLTALADGLSWPEGKRAAVSLSYDDALDSQLDHAIPTLNQHGIPGSFYLLLASPVVDERLDEWRAAAQAGHELGNHTLFHPCSKSLPNREWVAAHNNLDDYTLARMEQELATANSFLKAIDGRTERTLTPPCVDQKVSDGNYVDLFRDQFVAIKGAEQNLPEGFASYLLPTGHSGEELIAFVKAAAQRGGMANIIFHGVGGDHLSVSTEAHAQLVQYLSENEDTYWTDTYLNIMRYVNQTVE